jgi:non-ribosomal peptide synthetase component F
VEVGGARVSWALLDRRVRELAAGLAASGVRPGNRVALLVPPSADLTALVYAIWRAGAVIVVADKGLGVRGMGRALRGASVDWVVGTTQGLLAARAMRLPGRRLAAGLLPARPSARWARRRGWATSRRWAGGRRCRRNRPLTTSARSSSPPVPPDRPRASSTGTGRCRRRWR